MAAQWAEAFVERVKRGFIVNPIFPKKRTKTAIIPRKGMLVCDAHDYRLSSSSEKPDFKIILEVLIDERGNCKFKFLSGDSIRWTTWMSIRKFNRDLYIHNPWV